MSSSPAASESSEMPVGLRERKKQRMREQLKATALDEFAVRGYEQVTVEEIAHACNVSPRTFYRYFPTKEHVLVEESQVQMEAVIATLSARPADEPPARALQEALLANARLSIDRAQMLDHVRILRKLPSVLHSIQARGIRATTATLAKRMGVSPEDLDVRVVVGSVMAANSVALAAWLRSDGTVPLVDLIDEAFAALPESCS